jgi:hypothetical protein
MKKKLFLFIFILAYSIGYGQTNLVNNPSFETYDTCPDNLNQVNRAIGWNSVRPSPDYYNSCSNSSSDVSIPDNFVGFQYPASGNAYSGFEAKNGFLGAREYLGSQLISPLQIGTKYFISFKVNLSDFNYYCGINKLGILFSTNQYSNNNIAPICNCAQVYTNSIIVDSANWTMIKGSFVADSNYSFINIGNFFSDSLTDSIQLIGTLCFAYYYLDDVCVSTDSVYSYNYSWTEIKENTNLPTFSVFPNPAIDFVNFDLTSLQGTYTITIYDGYGREVFVSQIFDNPIEHVPIDNINSNILLIILKYKNKLFKYKIIKQKK